MSEPAVVYLLSSGWAGDDQADLGVFSTIEKAKQAAPRDVHWEPTMDPTARIHEGTTPSAFSEWQPWWIEEFEVDRYLGDDRSAQGRVSTHRRETLMASDSDMVTHELTLTKDKGGWDVPKCGCGWVGPPCPDVETAAEFYGDHRAYPDERAFTNLQGEVMPHRVPAHRRNDFYWFDAAWWAAQAAKADDAATKPDERAAGTVEPMRPTRWQIRRLWRRYERANEAERQERFNDYMDAEATRMFGRAGQGGL